MVFWPKMESFSAVFRQYPWFSAATRCFPSFPAEIRHFPWRRAKILFNGSTGTHGLERG